MLGSNECADFISAAFTGHRPLHSRALLGQRRPPSTRDEPSPHAEKRASRTCNDFDCRWRVPVLVEAILLPRTRVGGTYADNDTSNDTDKNSDIRCVGKASSW